jgi:DNA-binding transcriptional regulator PaaX
MGEQERVVQKRIRATKVNRAVIGVIATAGVLAVALVAPNAIGALGKIGFLPQRRIQARHTLTRLVRAGYVIFEGAGAGQRARLTKKGEAFAAQMRVGAVVPKKALRWDGKWRIVMFDVPEKRRSVRGRVRNLLKLFNFYCLQDSVWVYPYDCEDLITLLKVDLRLGNAVRYVIADSIENDAQLRNIFKLRG